MRNYRHVITLSNGRMIDFEKDSTTVAVVKDFITIYNGLRVNVNHVVTMEYTEVFDKE